MSMRMSPDRQTGYVRPTKAQYTLLLPFTTAERLQNLSHRLERSISQTVELLVEEHWRDEDLTPEVAYAVLGPQERRGRPRKRAPYLSLSQVKDEKVRRKKRRHGEEGGEDQGEG
jgi:predicted DNA-binding protein